MYHINIYQNTSSYPDIRIYILFCKIVIAWFCPFVSHSFVVQKWQWSKTQVSLVLCFDSPVLIFQLRKYLFSPFFLSETPLSELSRNVWEKTAKNILWAIEEKSLTCVCVTSDNNWLLMLIWGWCQLFPRLSTEAGLPTTWWGGGILPILATTSLSRTRKRWFD